MVYPLHIDLLLIEVYMIVITTCIQSVLVYMRLLHMHHVPNMLHVRYIWCIWYTLTWLEAQGPAIEAYMTVIKACIWSKRVYSRLLHILHVPNKLHVRYTWCIWYTWTWLEAHGPALEVYITVITAWCSTFIGRYWFRHWPVKLNFGMANHLRQLWTSITLLFLTLRSQIFYQLKIRLCKTYVGNLV